MIKNIYRENTKKVVQYTPGLLWWIIALVMVWFIGWYFMDYALISWNLWERRAMLEVWLLIVLMILFSFFVMISLYKFHYFSGSWKKETWLWTLWGIMWILVVWCPACSITIASYIGLASVLTLLPYDWLELKIAWVLLLSYTLWSSLRTLESCSLKKRKKKV